MGRARSSSIVHSMIETFFRGRSDRGGLREYWYASVETIRPGKRSARALTKVSNDPIRVPSRSSIAAHAAHAHAP